MGTVISTALAQMRWCHGASRSGAQFCDHLAGAVAILRTCCSPGCRPWSSRKSSPPILSYGVTERSAMTLAPCPRCGTESHRVHAWHVRRLADLPVGGRPAHRYCRLRVLIRASLPVRHLMLRRNVAPQALTWSNGSPNLAPPKSRASHRVVPLPSTVIDALRDHRHRQDSEREGAGVHDAARQLDLVPSNGLFPTC